MNLFQGDTRKHKHYVPISARAMEQFLDADFILREDIIKIQHKMKSTREKWRGRSTTYISWCTRAPIRVQEARHRREDVGVQEQREVAVAAGGLLLGEGFKTSWIYR